MTDTDMLYMASLEKRNEELEAKVAELEGKHWNECRQIAHYDDELKKAKQLLKAAVDDLKFESQCRNCKYQQTGLDNICNGCRGNKYEWRYANEALALIGEDTNVPAREDGAENG